MTTFYLDQEAGNDANDGTTFANRWKSFASGATAARIAPNDFVRIMESPPPTSLSMNGVWTSQALQAAIAITSSTNATPIVITRASHGLTTGDTIVITGHTTNTNANGTWEVNVLSSSTFELVNSTGNGVGTATGTFRLRNSSRITLASALTQTIACTKNRGDVAGRPVWTASANVTTSHNTTDTKAGDVSDSIAIAAGFTTGMAAYVPTGTLDLSGYQQVSFWFIYQSGTLGAAGSLQLKLCSDTAGATPVDTIDLPVAGALQRWQLATVDLGANLGASIQSIALYVATDNGAQTILFSNIIACKAKSSADSLTGSSLIGKNTGTEPWLGIQSIDGTRVMLDGDTQDYPFTAAPMSYWGTTETVTTYKRECILPEILGVAGTTAINAVSDSGTAGSPITFSGGWNRSDMTTQTGETWIDGRNGHGYGWTGNGRSYINWEKCCGVRLAYALQNNGTSLFVNYSNCKGGNNTTGCIFMVGDDSTIVNGSTDNNGVSGINTTSCRGSIQMDRCHSNTTQGIIVGVTNAHIFDSNIHNNGSYGIIAGASNSRGLRISGTVRIYNSTWAIYMAAVNGVSGAGLDIKNCTYAIFTSQASDYVFRGASENCTNICSADESTGSFVDWLTTSDTNVTTGAVADFLVTFERFNNTDNDHRHYGQSVTIVTDASVRHTASDYSHKCTISSATVRASHHKVTFPICQIPVVASALCTVKLWMRRDDPAVFSQLFCAGGQLPGVASDVTATITGAIDTWDEYTITFTPTRAGVISIAAKFWADIANKNTWIDDFSFTQSGSNSLSSGLNWTYNGRLFVGPESVAASGAGGGSIIGGSLVY